MSRMPLHLGQPLDRGLKHGDRPHSRRALKLPKKFHGCRSIASASTRS